jgi:uncharacterized tellurite resistance protein B-like protein
MADSNDPDRNRSFFELATGEEASRGAADRVQELKRHLFDLAYLVMNADGTEHISEEMLVQELEERMEREGSVDVEARADELAPLLDDGPRAIRERVLVLADEVAEQAAPQTEAVGARYLDFLRGLIVADARVSAEERELFSALCERWGVEKEVPGA